MFPEPLLIAAAQLLDEARNRGIKFAVAESCTGGLVAGLLTAIPGSSDVFERGFVTYSNDAKREMLGVPATMLNQSGAVSEQVARAMASGAMSRSRADITVSITGIAGPDGGSGGSEAKPVGLVHIAAASKSGTRHQEHRFGDIGRDAVRIKSVAAALEMFASLL
jgi:nicotinamide-nucleotide amidase